ncbi:MAG: hypothetical protein SFV23_24705 [Planctomycetaceae bacterium]|nr:hypothetical protein [Planctomycetaceae bacterium]
MRPPLKALLFSLVCFAASPVQSADTLPALDLPEIQSALDAYRDSLATLGGTYEHTVESHGAHPGALVMEDLRFRSKFQVNFANGLVNLERTKSWRYRAISPDELFSHYQRDTFDGKISMTLLHTMGQTPAAVALERDADVPNRLNISQQTDALLGIAPWMCAGLWGREGNLGLADQLRRSGGRLLEPVTVHGALCYQVRIGDDITAALDPTKDFIPRRITRTKGGQLLESIDNLIVKQFRDPRREEDYWLPVESHCVALNVTSELTVVELDVNPVETRETYRIDPAGLPPGILVRDETRPATDSKHSYVTGGRDDLWRERQQRLLAQEKAMEERLREAAQKRSTRSEQPPVRVQPPPPISSYLWWIIVPSVAILFIGLWLLRNRG